MNRLLFIFALVVSIGAAGAVERIENSSVENFFRLTPNLFSGATPEDEKGFAELQKLGIKTIISVDGAKPDTERAKRFGIRYVHLPVGYDGVSTNRQLQLIKAAQTFPGPIFVHCHHGEHRGPTAAAILCMGGENWSSSQSIEWMRQARTATNYAGLYKAVQTFEKPEPGVLAAVPESFPEHAQVSNMIEAMVAIDERMEHLKVLKKSGYRKSDSHPDLVPATEALLLHELYKELLRSPDIGDKHPEFLQELRGGEEATGAFYSLLQRDTFDLGEADAAFGRVTQNCSSCHREFRN